MKGYYIKEAKGGGTVFELRELPKPQPKKGEMLVKVRAASLNRGEILASISLHQVHEPHPAGGDCAGEVEAVGEGVTAFKTGDAILGRARGSFAEYVVMGAAQAAAKPVRLTWEQAAAVPIVAVTAYEAICQYGKLKSGETLLVAGAASGVGVAGVQIGRYLGAKVIGISRSAAKLDKLKSLGLDVGLRGRQLAERKHLVDHRNDAPIGVAGQHVAREAPHCFRALRGREQGVGDAEDLQPLAVHRLEVDLGVVLVVHVADDRDPALVCGRAHQVGENAAADEID